MSAYEGEFPIFFFGYDSVPRIVPQVAEGETFDYPFFGWHHLPDCYRATGWRDQFCRAVVLSGDQDPASARDVETMLLKNDSPKG